MNKDERIKELELEVARLKGVVEGMRTANPYHLYPRPAPLPYPYYPQPVWYQTYCTSGVQNATTGYLATDTGTHYGN